MKHRNFLRLQFISFYMFKCSTSFHADTLKSLDEDKRVNPRARQLEKILAKKLSEYLSCEVCYAIRRIMAAEQNHLYRGPDRGISPSLNHYGESSICHFYFAFTVESWLSN